MIKKTILSMAVMAVSVSVAVASIKDGVTKTLNWHSQAILCACPHSIKVAWDSDLASIVEVKGGKATKKGVVKTLALWTKQVGSTSKMDVNSITEVSKTIAQAEVKFKWKGESYSGSFTLVKGDKDWKIINFVYKAPKKEKFPFS